MRCNIPKSTQQAKLDRRAVAYVRMSTERQKYSTRNQLDTIEKYFPDSLFILH